MSVCLCVLKFIKCFIIKIGDESYIVFGSIDKVEGSIDRVDGNFIYKDVY